MDMEISHRVDIIKGIHIVEMVIKDMEIRVSFGDLVLKIFLGLVQMPNHYTNL